MNVRIHIELAILCTRILADRRACFILNSVVTFMRLQVFSQLMC